jgi:hypothetical protein
MGSLIFQGMKEIDNALSPEIRQTIIFIFSPRGWISRCLDLAEGPEHPFLRAKPGQLPTIDLLYIIRRAKSLPLNMMLAT